MKSVWLKDSRTAEPPSNDTQGDSAHNTGHPAGGLPDVPAHKNVPPPVILLHGLLNGPVWMSRLARGLQAGGREVFNLGYPSRHADIPGLADFVWTRIRARYPQGPIDIVAHSMGGIIARQVGAQHPGTLHRLVMLAPPNQGTELVDAARRTRLLRWLIGPAGLDLGCEPESAPNRIGPPDFEVGVIAGSKPDNPLSRRVIPGVEDGRVSVARTELDGMACRIVVPYGHFPMLWKRRVVNEVEIFLAHGHFSIAE